MLTAFPLLLALQLAGELPSAWLGLPVPGLILVLALPLAMLAARSRWRWRGARHPASHWRRRKEAAAKVSEAVHTKGGPSQRLVTKPLNVGGQQKNSFVRHTSTRTHGFWLRLSLMSGLLMGIAAAAWLPAPPAANAERALALFRSDDPEQTRIPDTLFLPKSESALLPHYAPWGFP